MTDVPPPESMTASWIQTMFGLLITCVVAIFGFFHIRINNLDSKVHAVPAEAAAVSASGDEKLWEEIGGMRKQLEEHRRESADNFLRVASQQATKTDLHDMEVRIQGMLRIVGGRGT